MNSSFVWQTSHCQLFHTKSHRTWLIHAPDLNSHQFQKPNHSIVHKNNECEINHITSIRLTNTIKTAHSEAHVKLNASSDNEILIIAILDL